MKLTIVIRLSALGDVAMLVPALYPVVSANPDDRFVLLTKKTVNQLFVNRPANLDILSVDTHDRHRGITGLLRLIADIFGYIGAIRTTLPQIDEICVADMHDVLRSQVIRSLLRLRGAKVAIIDKNRKAKLDLVKQHDKCLVPLKSSFERYCEVFQTLGYTVPQPFKGLFSTKPAHKSFRIGIAPFARHVTKIYPLPLMERVIDGLLQHSGVEIVLLGGRDDAKALNALTANRDRCMSVAGLLPFPDELALMNGLDVVLSMDSANMHLASLVGVPVVTVWGGTHPFAGFSGYGQNDENAVQVPLDCRPCSVFGCSKCRRGDLACMNQIAPENIIDRIIGFTPRSALRGGKR
jgi:ADP-heptose:LPS heptosyltransferase